MSLTINYDMSARDIMTNPEFPQRLAWMKRAGVNHLWVFGYFWGHHEADPEQIAKARPVLEGEGLLTGIVSVPVGHPGNSLNPDDPDLDLAIHPSWRYRIDRRGEKEYFSACIDDVMIAHNRAAAQAYAQMGYTRHFYDDDLRLGNHGDLVTGCFCDNCVAQFNARHGLHLSRAQLAAAIDADEQVRQQWIQYSCDKITKFMRQTTIPGMTNGIMVMHNGGRNHGISIPDIKAAVPGCMFRVGELNFDEQSFMHPAGRASLIHSVRNHLALIGSNPAYSESTVFPPNAMSPETWISKIKLEITLGLRNIFLMSGTDFFPEPYWRALAKALPELKDLAESCDTEGGR